MRVVIHYTMLENIVCTLIQYLNVIKYWFIWDIFSIKYYAICNITVKPKLIRIIIKLHYQLFWYLHNDINTRNCIFAIEYTKFYFNSTNKNWILVLSYMYLTILMFYKLQIYSFNYICIHWWIYFGTFTHLYFINIEIFYHFSLVTDIIQRCNINVFRLSDIIP